MNKQTYEDLIKYLSDNNTEYIKSNQIMTAIPEITQSSTLRAIINVLRKNGYPIISSSKGYKLTDDKEEVMKCIRTLQQRVKRINDACAGMMYYFVKQPIKL